MTELRTSLAAQVDSARDRLIATTQRLVAVASPNPPSDTEEIAKVAEALLREIPGIEVEVIEPAPRVKSLVGRLRADRPGRRMRTSRSARSTGRTGGWSAGTGGTSSCPAPAHTACSGSRDT